MRPEIIFFDIDDTLYDKENAFIPPSIDAAWQALREHNIAIAIATGRPPTDFPKALQPLLDKHRVETIVSMNGQYVTHRGQVLRNALLDAEVVAQLVDLCREKRLDYAFISEEGMFASSSVPKVAEALHLIGDFSVNPNYHLQRIMQQMLIFVDAQEEEALRLDPRYPHHYQMIRWHEHSVDFLKGNASKALGIAAVCEALQIAPPRTAAFGDGYNDLEMLQFVGVGIAMGNAVEALQAQADYITRSLHEDGILHALRHFNWI